MITGPYGSIKVVVWVLLSYFFALPAWQNWNNKIVEIEFPSPIQLKKPHHLTTEKPP